jgi:hypothetical protein
MSTDHAELTSNLFLAEAGTFQAGARYLGALVSAAHSRPFTGGWIVELGGLDLTLLDLPRKGWPAECEG